MANGTPDAQNVDLKSLYSNLVQINDTLGKSLDKIKDVDLAQATITEMREVLHRIDLVQSLLFTAATQKITNAVAAVNAANAQAVNSLKTITDITSLVKTVTGILTLVDKAIDLAKVVAL